MSRRTKILRPRASRCEPQSAAYRGDLAYIHHAGFGGFATGASPWLLALLRSQGFNDGLVTDLGCGSGIWAGELVAAGYRVMGFDISAAMVALARGRVPRGEFRQASFLEAGLRPSVAVTAIGEIFNYLFDPGNTRQRLFAFFARVYEALCPRGLFVFDVAVPGRVPEGRRRTYTEGDGWACLYEAVEDRRQHTITREITTFRRIGRTYRRDHEVHRMRLYDRAELLAKLREVGFRVRTVRDYGQTKFPPGTIGIVAQKA